MPGIWMVQPAEKTAPAAVPQVRILNLAHRSQLARLWSAAALPPPFTLNLLRESQRCESGDCRGALQRVPLAVKNDAVMNEQDQYLEEHLKDRPSSLRKNSNLVIPNGVRGVRNPSFPWPFRPPSLQDRN
jgi:hypothetical protein